MNNNTLTWILVAVLVYFMFKPQLNVVRKDIDRALTAVDRDASRMVGNAVADARAMSIDVVDDARALGRDVMGGCDCSNCKCPDCNCSGAVAPAAEADDEELDEERNPANSIVKGTAVQGNLMNPSGNQVGQALSSQQTQAFQANKPDPVESDAQCTLVFMNL